MTGIDLAVPVAWVSTDGRLREPTLGRLQAAAQSLLSRGVRLQVEVEQAGPFALFACWYVGQPSGSEPWLPIVRCHVAMALAEVVVGPLAERWLVRRLLEQARRKHLPLPPAVRPRAVQLARQLMEGPSGERGTPPGGGATASPPAPGANHLAGTPGGLGGAGPAGDLAALLAAQGLRPGLTGNLARWQSRIGRCLLEVLGGEPTAQAGSEPDCVAIVALEGVVRFRVKEFGQAIRRAAAAAVAELASERNEQRMVSPWRSLWLGPAPRMYEAHVLREGPGTYRVVDRWGEPAGMRTGEPAGPLAGEESLVSLLMRLAPRRIVAHLEPEDPAQLAIRGAFPGRVHTCRGCPRCLRRRQGSPRGSL